MIGRSTMATAHIGKLVSRLTQPGEKTVPLRGLAVWSAASLAQSDGRVDLPCVGVEELV
jgi:hypothetical protein